MILEVDSIDHPGCGVPASSVAEGFNPVGNDLVLDITGRPMLPSIELDIMRRPE